MTTAVEQHDQREDRAGRSGCEACGCIVVFRNDDLSGKSDALHERQVAEIFQGHRVPQTLSVIPCCTASDNRDPSGIGGVPLHQNPAIVSFLRECAEQWGYEIALHGYTHRPNEFSRPSRREYSEFTGMPLSRQVELIRQGVELLAGTCHVRPTTFVPPWNRFDRNTLTACVTNGLSILSAGAHAPTLDGSASLGVNCTYDTFPEVASTARDNAGGGQMFVVMYHSSTIRTTRDFAMLEEALEAAVQLPNVEFVTIQAAVARYPERVRLLNDAGVNVVPQTDLTGTPRARAVPYRRLLRRVGWPSRLDDAYAAARAAYERGAYQHARELSPSVDQLCWRLLWLGRLLCVLAGLMLGACVEWLLWAVLAVSPLGGAIGVLAAVGGAGAVGRWCCTAADTRREVLVATLLMTGAILVGALVVEWARL